MRAWIHAGSEINAPKAHPLIAEFTARTVIWALLCRLGVPRREKEEETSACAWKNQPPLLDVVVLEEENMVPRTPKKSQSINRKSGDGEWDNEWMLEDKIVIDRRITSCILSDKSMYDAHDLCVIKRKKRKFQSLVFFF